MSTSEHESLLGYTARPYEPINAQKIIKKKRFSGCCVKCCFILLVILAVVCTGIAVSLGTLYGVGVVNEELQDYIATRTAIVKGSASIKEWTSSDGVALFNVYALNLTNKDAFMKGAKPELEQIGPFVYRENTSRHDLVWSPDESIVKYNVSTNYIYDSEKSNGLDPNTAIINTINVPLLGLLVQFERFQMLAKQTKNKAVQEIINDILKGFDEALRTEFKENLFMTQPVDEVVFGYTDPFLKFVADLQLPIQGLPKDGQFAITKRSSSTAPNMIYTGKHNPRATDRIMMHEGHTSMKGWGSPYAGMMNGTQAILFHPGVERTDTLSVFVRELYRSIDFSYKQDVEIDGVKMYEFQLADYVLSSNKSDPGFYMNGPDGAFNLSAVYPLNVPVFMTKPHFLDCPAYLKYVDGLKPVRKIHDTLLHVEPLTGAILAANKRLQVNVKLTRNSNITELSQLQNITVLPLLWIEEGGNMNSNLSSLFKKMVYRPVHYVDGFAIGISATGGFVALLSCLLLVVLLICIIYEKKR